MTGATADKTLVRAVVSSRPLVPWTTGANQWDVYPKDTFVDGSSTTWNAATGGMLLPPPETHTELQFIALLGCVRKHVPGDLWVFC